MESDKQTQSQIAIQQFKEKYAELQKQFDLPLFDKLDDECEITDNLQRLRFAPSKPLLFVRRILVDKYFTWINYLHTFISPNQQSILLMNEYQQFADNDRKVILDILRQIMLQTRLSTRLDLSSTPQFEAQFIKESFALWLTLKEQLKPYLDKNIASWKKPFKDEEYSNDMM